MRHPKIISSSGADLKPNSRQSKRRCSQNRWPFGVRKTSNERERPDYRVFQAMANPASCQQKPILAVLAAIFSAIVTDDFYPASATGSNDFIQAMSPDCPVPTATSVRDPYHPHRSRRDVLQVLMEKWTQHNQMVENMTEIIRKLA